MSREHASIYSKLKLQFNLAKQILQSQGNENGGQVKCLVAWDQVCRPGDLGSLGIMDLACFD